MALGQLTLKPYEQVDRRIPHSIDGATIIKAGDKLSPEEAMGLSQYYKEAGLLKIVDRFDGLNKSVGDEEYRYPDSKFWTFNPGNTPDDGQIQRSPYTFKRKTKMNEAIVKDFIKVGGTIVKEDPSDLEATIEKLALGGYTARGFWKACTRMAHF